MSVAQIVLNQNLWKLVLALAIPTLIGSFFWFSQESANKQMKEFEMQQKEKPSADHAVISNYSMKEIDDHNTVRWELKADSGQMLPDGKNVSLTAVTVEYFDPQTKALKMRLSAPAGTANQETKYVVLKGDGVHRVIAEGEGGKSKFVANDVELTKQNQFSAKGGVIIEWPGVAKVSGDCASGSTNMAAGPKDFKIVGNTHAEIAVR